MNSAFFHCVLREFFHCLQLATKGLNKKKRVKSKIASDSSDTSMNETENFPSDDSEAWYESLCASGPIGTAPQIGSMSGGDSTALAVFNASIRPKKKSIQRPRPKGVPSVHLGIRLPKYDPVDSRENTLEEIASYKAPAACYVCHKAFGCESTTFTMAMHYYEEHRKLVPFNCPFPKVSE